MIKPLTEAQSQRGGVKEVLALGDKKDSSLGHVTTSSP